MEPTYTLGAKINSNDNRDIHFASVTAPVELAPSIITDISAVPVYNQLSLGTCVGHAEGEGEEFRDFKETGIVTTVSKRYIYKSCKLKDGDPNQGTYPRIAGTVLSSEGAPRVDLVPDTNNLAYSDYMNVEIGTNDIRTDASGRRVKGYAFCYTLTDVKQAIAQKGILNATLQVGDWSQFPVKPMPSIGNHRVLFFGYEDGNNNGKADTKIYFRNSWGVNWGQSTDGNGWFWWSDYQNYIFDMMVYTDMPNEVIDYAKAQQYKFTRVLHRGMSGTDVMELQKRLAKETAFDGQPCFSGTFDTSFGPITEGAVQRYQKTKGIVSQGTWQTTGYGQLGPKTMAMLNTGLPSISKLEGWADAIQLHEGWYVGSRSYRNNNPGNLKYVGQALAIGKDTGGFCIFKSYADGRLALTNMLKDAATPPPGIYQPEMTLGEFFAKYAPSADNNDPDAYAAFVAKKIGVTVDTPIKSLV